MKTITEKHTWKCFVCQKEESYEHIRLEFEVPYQLHAVPTGWRRVISGGSMGAPYYTDFCPNCWTTEILEYV